MGGGRCSSRTLSRRAAWELLEGCRGGRYPRDLDPPAWEGRGESVVQPKTGRLVLAQRPASQHRESWLSQASGKISGPGREEVNEMGVG